ncbi:glycoside hydrolase family 15 [Actinomadura logoneensis]|uniref:Glycoside hydrolase family 15 n=1 Tax=Actinomadura logoneensis TaxID=2293572 RepID=A0A372JIU0_9ACTN|nr:glycoside hydrolase family 15 protein [Actinomadura logoneensis]RFU39927.1 glycoside hydrolase family 15 [Actinomadura logoneensis]
MRDRPSDTGVLAKVYARSLEVILAGQAASGAYPACPAYPVYRYSWLRDGSFIAESMSRVGQADSAAAFHDWCAAVITAREDRIGSLLRAADAGETIPRSAFLPTRYRLDGTDADTSDEQWWDFQLDGYGMWLWTVGEHARRHQSDPRRWQKAVVLTVRYLARFWDRPCYDWWEEHPEERHTSTLAAIHAGLRSALRLGLLDTELARTCSTVCDQIQQVVQREGIAEGHLTKWLGGRAVDASLIACLTPFALVPAEGDIAESTLRAVEETIAHGGVHRYAADTFYGGGEWPLLAALLGWHYARIGSREKAWRQLHWVADQADARGDLPEQVPDHLLHPEYRLQWIQKWGPVASPLLWSHAMFLILADELGFTGEAPGSSPEPTPHPSTTDTPLRGESQ